VPDIDLDGMLSLSLRVDPDVGSGSNQDCVAGRESRSGKATVKSFSLNLAYTCRAFQDAGEIGPQAIAGSLEQAQATQNRLHDRKNLRMKKWEYTLLVQLWDPGLGRFYWADHETDPRNSQERLEALAQEGWEVVSAFPCGERVRQQNYLLRRSALQN